jgi:hypothetical protein
LCALQKIASSILRKRPGSGKTPGPPVHDDHVGRVFHADRLDRIWLTDISEHPTGEGKLYICAVKDVCSRKIVGYAIGPRMTSHLADAALRTAIAPPVSDRHRGGSFGPRRSVPITSLPADPAGSWPDRLDGPGLLRGRQRRDGELLLAAPEERPQPPDLDHPRGAPPGDHHLDRTHLPPAPAATRPWQADPGRVRSHHRRDSPRASSMTRTTAVNQSLGRPVWR